MLQCWPFSVCLVDVAQHEFVTSSHDGLDSRSFHTIDDVLLRQQERGRNGHGTNFVQGQHGEPELVAAFHDEHDEIPLADAQGAEIAHHLVGLAAYVGEGESAFDAFVVAPQQG